VCVGYNKRNNLVMRREEYQGILNECSLSAEQVQAMGAIIEEYIPMRRFGFIEGWNDEMRSVCDFLCGDLGGRGEFEDNASPVNVDLDTLLAQAASVLEGGFSAVTDIIRPCAIGVATQFKVVLSEEQQQAFGAAMKSLAVPRLSAIVRFLSGRWVDARWPEEGRLGARGVWWIEFIKSWDCK